MLTVTCSPGKKLCTTLHALKINERIVKMDKMRSFILIPFMLCHCEGVLARSNLALYVGDCFAAEEQERRLAMTIKFLSTHIP
jgi:hypothetical protein